MATEGSLAASTIVPVPVTAETAETTTHATLALASSPGQASAPPTLLAGEVITAKASEAADSATTSTLESGAGRSMFVADQANTEEEIIGKALEAVDAAAIRSRESAAVASEYITNRANDVRSAAHAHAASAGEYLATKTNEAGEVIQKRISMIHSTTMEHIDSIANKTKESAMAAGNFVTSKAVETMNVTRETAVAAHSRVVTTATDHIEATKCAKVMDDEGGQDVEDKLIAKAASRDATALHTNALASLANVAQCLRDAEARLLKASTVVCAAQEATEFKRVAPTYVKRAAEIEAFLATIEGDLESTAISNKESIAIGMLNTKLGLRSLFEPRQLLDGIGLESEART